MLASYNLLSEETTKHFLLKTSEFGRGPLFGGNEANAERAGKPIETGLAFSRQRNNNVAANFVDCSSRLFCGRSLQCPIQQQNCFQNVTHFHE
ncbi:hypothetical protein DdX_05689 [Ditylenchus destructor]|uniref:Uncharacterized protein n=1 Tax=Ditylenchus destructor TaxID=166010 RepID=A0AAD4N6K6_9BILA|nr:hypothetical protein DdX_05689 [Ditylenchus destructor]